MSTNINKILIIGATSGLGEAFARNFHAQGKSVVITGRRQERLEAIQADLRGIDIFQWDITDLSNIPSQSQQILKAHADIDTVFINAGMQKFLNFQDPSTFADTDIITEVTTNVTAPFLLARAFLPHLAKVAASGKPANLIMNSSGLAFFPMGFVPVYSTTKSAIHAFAVTLRQQYNSAPQAVKENLSICEVAPPYVDTGLDHDHRELVQSIIGLENAPKPMSIDEYMAKTMPQFAELEHGKLKKEIGTGFSQMGIDLWRNSLGKAIEGMGMAS